MKRLKRIAAFVLPPVIAVLACSLLIRRFPLFLTLAFVVPVAVTVVVVIVVVVIVALRRD